MNIQRPNSARSRRLLSLGLSCVLATAVWTVTTEAAAAPRDDMRTAYDAAVGQFNELEFDAATATIDSAIAAADGAGAGSDPVLASLYVVQAALVYSTEGDAGAAKILESLKKAAAINYYVVVPLEMRSDGLNNYLEQARAAVGAAPSEAVAHKTPEPACGVDLKFEALLGVPDGGQAALYWRPVGETDFRAAEMPVFSNVAEAMVPAAEHADKDVEYFIFAFDSANQPVANKGTQEAPILLQQGCVEPEPVPAVEPDVEPEPEPDSSLPKFWINIGLGLGLGIARGEAEHTWSQFDPVKPDELYDGGEAGCAIARWAAAGQPASSLDGGVIGAAWNTYGAPGQFSAMESGWDGATCDERYGVSGGFALAPFHLAPEFSFRLGERISLGVFGRLQLVTATNLKDADPDKALNASFQQDVRNPDPSGVEIKPAFTWAAGIKFKYFLGKDGKKFRPFVGAFAGYGQSRLRVDLGIKNDENGNSIPDDREIAYDTDANGDCFPVWPYHEGCVDGSDDQLLADTIRANSAGDENRVDTVPIGPVFIGALAGFNLQLHKHFALFGELQLGGWFPKTGSFLIDFNVGPAITF